MTTCSRSRFSCVLAALALAVFPAKAERLEPLHPESVLWIGNSFTYYNGGVPAMVSQLAGGAIRTGMHAIGGAHLPDHAANPAIPIDDDWDLVVVQGYSDGATNPAKASAFNKALGRLTARIRKSDAAPALFMTWAYKDRPAMTGALAEAYAAAGAETDAPVIPVGLAFATAKAARPQLRLYVTEDNRHPSPAGTYLAACTFYAAFFGHPPKDGSFTPSGLTPGDAAFLRETAFETVRSYAGWPD